jgi:hypothetical protein
MSASNTEQEFHPEQPEDLRHTSMRALSVAFREFISKVIQIPGAKIQKQQAFYRLDEAQMWMQNAILSYIPEQQKQEQADGTTESQTP